MQRKSATTGQRRCNNCFTCPSLFHVKQSTIADKNDLSQQTLLKLYSLHARPTADDKALYLQFPSSIHVTVIKPNMLLMIQPHCVYEGSEDHLEIRLMNCYSKKLHLLLRVSIFPAIFHHKYHCKTLHTTGLWFLPVHSLFKQQFPTEFLPRDAL